MSKKEAAPPEMSCLCMGLGPKVTAMFQCQSDAARGHMRSARVEFLKALRSMIDERIERLSKEQKKGTSVPVE
ncbi:MAG: hypothetical protein ABFD60_09940 [Bryobacteraceae bacterium]